MTTATDLSLSPVPEAEAATPLPWLKPLVAAVVLLLALFSLLDVAVAYIGRTMPALHYVAAPIGVGVMVLIWCAELGGLPWPRLLFVALVTAPNLWLAYIGHVSVNYLFLMLTVAWVAYRGSRAEGLVTLALNLAVPAVPLLVDVAHGGTWYGAWYQAGFVWIPWAALLVFAWGMSRALVRQQRLAAELSALLEVSHTVASTLELQPLLALILDQLQAVVPYTGAGIGVQDGEEVRIIGYRGPGPEGLALGTRLPVATLGPLWAVLRQREPVIIADVRADEPLARLYRQAVGDALETSFGYVRSWMAVPLRAKERVVGSLFLEHGAPDSYTDQQAALALAFAQQAAVAIENARLYEQAQYTAQMEERQRLARELHDAVTQTLFASSLIAGVLPRLWERDPAEGRRRLAELRELTRGALAEMRTLLYELRPAALAEVPLGDLLRQLVDATIGHARLPVSLSVEGQRALPPDVQVALYRLAQEALNNVAKHARASRAEVSLVYRADSVELCLHDDGRGFDLSQIPPGHLGVGIMRERALAVGAELDIASRPGQGTRLTVTWPDSGRNGENG